MLVPSVAAAAVRVAQTPVQDAPASPRKAPSGESAGVAQPADSVTISHTARLAAAAATGDAVATARTAVRGASSAPSAGQATTGQYAAKVRAALARGGNASVTQIMASLGIPQAEQARVAAAVGAAPKSTY